MRIMEDSITAGAVNGAVDLVAGYIDLPNAWTAADWERFPPAKRVLIARDAATDAGDVLDVETGLAPPEQAAGWIRLRQASGYYRPTIYCNRGTRPAVAAACAGLSFDWWIATLDGSEVAGVAAAQVWGAASAAAGGRYVDVSYVYDDGWPHRSGGSFPTMTPDQEAQLLGQVADMHAAFSTVEQQVANIQAWAAAQGLSPADVAAPTIAAGVAAIRAAVAALAPLQGAQGPPGVPGPVADLAPIVADLAGLHARLGAAGAALA